LRDISYAGGPMFKFTCEVVSFTESLKNTTIELKFTQRLTFCVACYCIVLNF